MRRREEGVREDRGSGGERKRERERERESPIIKIICNSSKVPTHPL